MALSRIDKIGLISCSLFSLLFLIIAHTSIEIPIITKEFLTQCAIGAKIAIPIGIAVGLTSALFKHFYKKHKKQ